jgi:hypothetical protein
MKAHEFFTRLFCRHDFRFALDLFLAIEPRYKSLWICYKCDAAEVRDYFYWSDEGRRIRSKHVGSAH